MTDAPAPALIVQWTRHGYREVAFWDAAGLSPEALHEFAGRVSEPIMFRADDLEALRAAIETVASDVGLRVEYLTSGHDDPLMNRFGVTLWPK